MPVIGVRELREHTSEVLRQVREEHAEYVVTHQGRPVALIMPVNPEAVEQAMVEASRANLIGGTEAYARLVTGGRQVPVSAGEQAARPRSRARRARPSAGEHAGATPEQERRGIGHQVPDILD